MQIHRARYVILACAMSVREEISEVPGVSAVEVDLASGHMTVTGSEGHG
jgi:copper chaperone CopZ